MVHPSLYQVARDKKDKVQDCYEVVGERVNRYVPFRRNLTAWAEEDLEVRALLGDMSIFRDEKDERFSIGIIHQEISG